jgi:hypothetical protein
MRKLLIAGVAIASLTGNAYGQVAAPTVTPMPSEPNRELKAEIETALRVLRDELGPATPQTPPPVLGQPTVLAGRNECALRDQATHPVNTKVRFNGASYLCIEVLDSQLSRQGVAWMRVAD